MAGNAIGRDPSERLRVLVAEDDKDAANSFGELLASWGYEVRVVYDGLAALESAQAHPPHVALIDLGLPGMDGYQVALRLRRRPELSGLKLIAVTGFPDAGSRCQEYGFDEHLMKPIDPDRLRDFMTRLFNAQDSGDARHETRDTRQET
jgi:CheY-like chemotaxis protein